MTERTPPRVEGAPGLVWRERKKTRACLSHYGQSEITKTLRYTKDQPQHWAVYGEQDGYLDGTKRSPCTKPVRCRDGVCRKQ